MSPNSKEPSRDLLPPSSYARRIPLHAFPTKADSIPFRKAWKFAPYVRSERDKVYKAQTLASSPTRTHSESVGGVGLEWAAWYELVDENERITPSTLCFLADVFENIPSQTPGTKSGDFWYPTVAMTIDFKCRIPTPSEDHASRTVGIYSCEKPPSSRFSTN